MSGDSRAPLRGKHVVAPPAPPGAVGWNVWTVPPPGYPATFIEFIPLRAEIGARAQDSPGWWYARGWLP